MNKKCIDCNVELKKTFVKYRDTEFEALQCQKCKQKIFTEELAMNAISKLEEKRLKTEYVKRPIKIGHSLGITFPKEVANVFGLDSNSLLKIHPNIKKSIIEISLS